MHLMDLTGPTSLKKVRCAATPRHIARAITLIEMLVVLSIFTIIMGIVFTAFKLNDTYRDIVLVRTRLNRQSKRALDAITEELARSSINRVNITNPNELIFQVPLEGEIDARYRIPWGGYYRSVDYVNGSIRYALNGTDLIRSVLDESNVTLNNTLQIIATHVVNLTFNQPSVFSIGLNITLQKDMRRGRTVEFNANSTVYLGN